MLELISQSPMPTTVVAVGLTVLIAATGSTVRGAVFPQKEERLYPANAQAKHDPTFSFFDFQREFKELPQAFAEPYREMLAFKAFKDGWDGIGSKGILDDSVNAALAFLALLPSDVLPPEASAASDGTVDWYWRKGSKAATVTFYKDRKAAYFALTDGGSAKDVFKLTDSIPGQLVESLRQL